MEVRITHPVYPSDGSSERFSELEQSVAPLMAMSEEDLVALVPDRTGFRYVACPSCEEGTHESQLTWTVDDPHRVTCRFCGTIHPGEAYPEDETVEVTNPLGARVSYPCCVDDSGRRYFFSARAWWYARFYLAERARDLGRFYQMTGDARYARRSTWILHTFACHYPGYLVCLDEVHRPKAFHNKPPFPRRGGKWGEWRYQEIPTDLVFAYDSVFESGELERLSEESGSDVRRTVEEGFFRGALRQDDYHGPLYTNASPATYEGYAVLGRVLGDPSLVHEAVRRSRGLFERHYYVDGFWCQGSVDYHRYTMRGMQVVFDAVRGYTDPPGYVDPEDGTRFDDFDMARELPIVGRAVQVPEICRYPDGRRLPVHDSWWRYDELLVPQQSASTLLPGVGHAWLGRGEKDQQIQAHLHFSDGQHGHSHADTLGLSLFAKGQELLSDVGYSWSRYKQWTNSSLCHNTVLIDEQEQHRGDGEHPGDGQLLTFETTYETVQWLEASGDRAYPDLASRYRRALVLIDAGDGEAYVVDLFRVTGGSQHDWVVHGSADRDSQARANVGMSPYAENMLPGVTVRLPRDARDSGEAGGRNPNYGFIRDVSSAEAVEDVAVTFALSGQGVGTRTNLAGLSAARAFLGDAPSIRQADENDAKIDQFRMPILIVRREGEAPLSSCFPAVHEPYGGAPFIDSVARVTLEGDDDTIILEVKHHGVTDHIIHNIGPRDREVAADDLSLRGESGFVRERAGVPELMGIWGGTELCWKSWALAGAGALEGKVTRALRADAGDPYDALVLPDPLPGDEVLNGSTVVVTFGDGSTMGLAVSGSKSVGDDTHLLLTGDPGITVDDSRMQHLFCPRTGIAGPVRYLIRCSAFATVQNGELHHAGKTQFART